MPFFSAVILLLLVTDPFGNVPYFLSALRNLDPRRRRPVILRECLIAFVVLSLFSLFGGVFLRLLQLSETSLGIAGGVILFLIALRMVFPHPDNVSAPAEEEPFIVPLAIPYIAGPSALATVLLLMSREPGRWLEWFGAIAVSMAITTTVLIFGDQLCGLVGRRGVIAFERLMGLILTALAVEMFLTGIEKFVLHLRALP